VETRRHRSLCYQQVAHIQLRTVLSFVDDGYDEKSEDPVLARHHTAQPARIPEHILAACHTAEHCRPDRTDIPFEAGIDTHIAAAGRLHHTTRDYKHVSHFHLLEMASSSRPLHWTMLPPAYKPQKHEKHPAQETHRRPCPATPDTSALGHWFHVRHPRTRRRLDACKGSSWSGTNLRNGI